ncbi:hypothetical protein N9R80_00305 [bacterium]|nr:hypothetical protein [bacterium]
MRFCVVLLGVLTHGLAWGHELTPTYPELKTSYLSGVLKAEMHLFNSRKDINYYSVSVYDKDWKPVKFATESKIIQMDYLDHRDIEVYVRKKDQEKARYICTKSKILKGKSAPALVASRICSKIK